jgi:DNA-binding NarL/FixJ family response regulator
MVVDDFKQWRATLRSIVEAVSGLQVVAEVGDALEAIAKAGRLRPDIVLLDVGLPLLNGIEAAPRIRRASPGSKIIFLTQEDDNDVRTAALATGAEAYLLKSRVVAELSRVIDAARRISDRHPLPKHVEIPHSDLTVGFPELRLEVQDNT